MDAALGFLVFYIIIIIWARGVGESVDSYIRTRWPSPLDLEEKRERALLYSQQMRLRREKDAAAVARRTRRQEWIEKYLNRSLSPALCWFILFIIVAAAEALSR
jgi:hypothetical protein